MPRRPRRPGPALALAVALTSLSMAWAGSAVLARTSDSDTVGANAFTTAAAWGCASPGVQAALTPSADSWNDQASPSQNKGTDSNLFVMSKSGTPNANRRSLLRFTLPALPAGCTVTVATLRLYNNSPLTGRIIGVYQGDPAAALWTEGGVTWTNQPAPTGTAVTSTTTGTAGYQTWTVTAHVQAHYAGPNNGFVVRDQTENAAAGPQQNYISRESGSNRPELIITRG